MNVEPLPYSYDALEPYIDKQTMQFHHDKHYQAYCNKYTKALEQTKWEKKDIEEVLKHIDDIPKKTRQTVINDGGGYYHHRFFWTILKKNVACEGELASAIKQKWGSLQKFQQEFNEKAKTLFGSGWTWLVLYRGKLQIANTSNQDSPISKGMKPILCIDVWEHAYYLKYQNKRAEYIANFWNVINWKQANEYFNKAK